MEKVLTTAVTSTTTLDINSWTYAKYGQKSALSSVCFEGQSFKHTEDKALFAHISHMSTN